MKKRRQRIRTRLPRVLFTEMSVVRAWCELEARAQTQLGRNLTDGMAELIQLSRPNTKRIPRVLMLFKHRLVIAQVRATDVEEQEDDEDPGDLLQRVDESADKVFA